MPCLACASSPARVAGLINGQDGLSKTKPAREAKPATDTGDTPLLEVEQVAISFGGLQALAGVSLNINPGEMLGLIGPNGSGKSTLFNVITGFLKPERGSVRLQGQDITGNPPHRISRLGVARTFQLVRPFPHLSVQENVAAGRVYGSDPAGSIVQAKAEALEILDRIGLGDKAATLARDLTTIDRKRLELGRALAVRPKLMLLDEFMTGLNPTEMRTAMQLLTEINAMGVTLVVVEHIVRAVMDLCQRVAVLNVGKLIAEGTPQQVAGDQEVVSAYLGSSYATD